MSFQKIGVDISGLDNIEPMNYTLNTSIQRLANDIPTKANELTNGYLGLGVSLMMLGFLTWFLSDTSEFGRFRFNTLRAFGVSMSIVAILGMLSFSFGFFVNIYHIIVFIILTFVMNAITRASEF